MENKTKAQEFLKKPETEQILVRLYGNDSDILRMQRERYQKLIGLFELNFKTEPDQFFSAPGRIELSGNHTDHNNGRVLAAATQLDTIGLAAKTDKPEISLFSEGFQEVFHVDLNSEMKPNENLEGTSTAIIMGIAARFKELGYKTGGFEAVVSTQVSIGSGISASASFEVLVAEILNALYNDNKIDPVELAKISKYSENIYFGKPCGLMDQLICAVGGIAAIDFEDPESPKVQTVNYDFGKHNYEILIVNTGADHSNLTKEYAAIPNEMYAVAENLGAKVCRDISIMQLLENIDSIRTKTGDRAVLRAYHFVRENNRVPKQFNAIQNEDLKTFLELVNESGNSSIKWLQNFFVPSDVEHQGITLGLALAEDFINKIGEGACRVHGGGFAGTILVFIPKTHSDDFIQLFENIFGENSTMKVYVRPYGTVHLNSL